MSDAPAVASASAANNLICNNTISHARRQMMILLLATAVIFLLALSLRLVFARAVLAQNSLAELRMLHADSRGYLNQAQRLAEGQSLADPQVMRSREQALVRPPLYVAFLALAQGLGNSIPAIFFVQSIVGALIPLMVVALGEMLWGNRPWAMALALLAGLGSALSGTGIAISSIVLTDLLFAALFLAGFVTMILAVRNPRWIISASAGLLLALASLTKPSTVYWPIVSVPMWIILARGANQPLRLRNLAILIGVQFLLMGTWCVRNYRAEGIFTFSTIADRNLRFEVAPIVEEWSQRDHFPTAGEIRGAYRRAEEEGLDFLQHHSSVADYIRWEHDGALSIMWAHPGLAIRVILANIYNQVTQGWRSFDRQLPQRRIILRVTMLLDSVWYGRLPSAVWMILALAAVLIPNKQMQKKSVPADPAHRWNQSVVISLWVTLVYFTILSGTTRDQGSRILYSVEFAKIILVIEALRRLYYLSRRIIAAEGRSQAPCEPQ